MKPNTLQLRVIRAFKSTLEDMEEKRSCHSMHSVRSTRSYLSRPASDISYIEDEEKQFMAAHAGGGVDLGVHMGGAAAVAHLTDQDEEELETVKGEVLEALVVLNMVQNELSHVAAFSEQVCGMTPNPTLTTIP